MNYLTTIPTIIDGQVVERPCPEDWRGIRVTTQAEADELVPELLREQAVVRFLWCEPLLGPMDFDCWPETGCPRGWLDGNHCIDWLIVGGEDKPLHPDWVRSLRGQAVATETPFMFTGWGAWAPKGNFAGIDDWNRAKAYALVQPDGRHTICEGEDIPDEEFGLRCCDLDGESGAAAMARVGKGAAGRLLDGRTWDELPEGIEVPHA